MGVKWTKQQQKVIDLRNRNILVSAAAGSGKTAVLVERIIQKITAEQSPVDVDRLLIVTFTEAAAAEMKDRIREAIEKKLEENPPPRTVAIFPAPQRVASRQRELSVSVISQAGLIPRWPSTSDAMLPSKAAAPELVK